MIDYLYDVELMLLPLSSRHAPQARHRSCPSDRQPQRADTTQQQHDRQKEGGGLHVILHPHTCTMDCGLLTRTFHSSLNSHY